MIFINKNLYQSIYIQLYTDINTFSIQDFQYGQINITRSDMTKRLLTPKSTYTVDYKQAIEFAKEQAEIRRLA